MGELGPFSKLACKLSPDGKTLAAGAVTVDDDGGAVSVAAVGTPEHFSAHATVKPSTSMSFFNRFFGSLLGFGDHSVTEADLNGGNRVNFNSAKTAQLMLKDCDKNFPHL